MWLGLKVKLRFFTYCFDQLIFTVIGPFRDPIIGQIGESSKQ